MTWPPTALLAAAAAALAVVPAAAGGDAHAMQGDQGSIIILDRRGVVVFHPNGTPAFQFGLAGEVSNPSSVAVGPDGRIVVAGGNRIHVFHPNGTPALAWSYGTDGERPGCAVGVAVGPDGRIVVADTGTHSIKVFHPNGTHALTFGSYGDGERQFNSPSGVAVGPDGRIVVADTRNGRIQVFHPNGTPALAFGVTGSCGCIAAGPDGSIVTGHNSDFGYGRIHVYHPNGTFASGFDTAGGERNRVVTVAAGPVPPTPPPSDPPPSLDDPCPPPAPAPGGLRPGMIVVADVDGASGPYNASGRVKVFHPNGTPAFDFGQFDFGRGYDDGVAVGPDGRIVVAEGSNHRVKVFHPNGTFACAFGQPRGYDEWTGRRLPPGDGQFTYTPSVAVGPDGRIVVANSHGPVQVFHPNGTFAFTLEDWVNVRAVAVGPDGRIVVAGSASIYVLHPNGTRDLDFGLSGYLNYREQLGWPDVGGRLSNPRDVAVGPDGRIVVAEVRARIHVFHPNGTHALTFGSLGTGPGQFNLTIDYGGMTVAVGPDGRIVAGDPGGNRIHVFHPNGTHALTFGLRGGGGMGLDYLRGVAVAPRAPAPGNATSPPPSPPAPVTVVVEPGAPVGPLNFTGAGDAANLTIDVARLAGPVGPPLNGSESSTVRFPAAETVVAASFATVSFPPNVTAAHVPAGGQLALHVSADVPNDARVQGALAYDGSGRVKLQRVVEVGSASGRVVFDMPVRILLEGQAGGRAFYIEEGGTITPIDAACAADDAARVHRHLVGGAGECQMDSANGGKIIYTYHLTKFGTALPVGAAPPPAVHTCSVGLGAPDLGMSARPGELSEPVRQTVINSGSAPFARVDLAATAWSAGPSQGADDPAPLPASTTEVVMEGAGDAYVPLANGTAVAAELGGGQEAGLWFRLNLAPYEDVRAGTLVQEVTYQAMCRVP